MRNWSRRAVAGAASEFEYELIDTGVFDEDRYFDVFVEYAKASPDDILIQISVHNRGPEAAELHVLPTLWFRNQWSWQTVATGRHWSSSATLRRHASVIKATDPKLGDALPVLRRRCAATVHRERDQHRAHLRCAEPQPLRQGQHQQLHRSRHRRRREPRKTRNESGGPLSR